MRKTESIFYEVMSHLQEHGVLDDIILIGSWCLFFYKEHFGNSHHVPEVRTLDLDFLVPNPPHIKKKVNVKALLEQLGFKEKHDTLSGLSKFSHKDLVVEFLIPELGRGKNEAYEVKKLNINAVGLRFLNLLQSHTITMTRDQMTVRLPEPAVYVLHKHIISERRLNLDKKDKDKRTALELGRYLLKIPEQREKLKEIFVGMPKKWQKTLLKILLLHHKDMHDFLWDIK